MDIVLNYKKLPRLKQARRIPQLFTKEEIRKILDCTDSLTRKSMFMLAYGSGLRNSEITNLKVTDIESDKMRILIQHGKGDCARYAMLPQATLETMRDYWKVYRPKDWLFVAPHKGCPYLGSTLNDAFKNTKKIRYN